MFLAVNGSLMRGLALNQNMLDAGAVFIREDHTAACYRMWSIRDEYPGMIRFEGELAGALTLEIWEVDAVGLVSILEREPPGLSIGRVLLEAGAEVLGVLAEPYLVEGMPEITFYRGWREYLDNK